MLRTHFPMVLAAVLVSTLAITASANETKLSAGETVLAEAAAAKKHTFILFYKAEDAVTLKIAKILDDAVAVRGDRATVMHVPANDPGEKRLVEKYKVARTPMPLTLCVAPNGAVTGVYSQKLEDRLVEEAIVSPKTADCLKAVQDNKVVILCVRTPESKSLPKAISEFKVDPHFNTRLAVIDLATNDKTEASFLANLEVDPTTVKDSIMVFMAPPGVMVGRYTAAAPKALMAADLHKAGKCCDDPNCKHGKQGK
jgi:hypothetical protein